MSYDGLVVIRFQVTGCWTLVTVTRRKKLPLVARVTFIDASSVRHAWTGERAGITSPNALMFHQMM